MILWICGTVSYWVAFWMHSHAKKTSCSLGHSLACVGIYLTVAGLTGTLLVITMCCAFSTQPLQALQLASMTMLNIGLGLTGTDLTAPLRWLIRPWTKRMRQQFRELEDSFLWESPASQDSQFL